MLFFVSGRYLGRKKEICAKPSSSSASPSLRRPASGTRCFPALPEVPMNRPPDASGRILPPAGTSFPPENTSILPPSAFRTDMPGTWTPAPSKAKSGSTCTGTAGWSGAFRPAPASIRTCIATGAVICIPIIRRRRKPFSPATGRNCSGSKAGRRSGDSWSGRTESTPSGRTGTGTDSPTGLTDGSCSEARPVPSWAVRTRPVLPAAL